VDTKAAGLNEVHSEVIVGAANAAFGLLERRVA